MSESCIFCKIIRGEIPSHKVYEDEKTLALLDINPTAPGHTLLIPKAHVSNVEDLTLEDAESLFRALHKIVGGIQKAMDAPASTIGVNNGRESGQEIPHVHIHIIQRPKKNGMTRLSSAGRFKPRSKECFEKIAEKIREEIRQ